MPRFSSIFLPFLVNQTQKHKHKHKHKLISSKNKNANTNPTTNLTCQPITKTTNTNSTTNFSCQPNTKTTNANPNISKNTNTNPAIHLQKTQKTQIRPHPSPKLADHHATAFLCSQPPTTCN
ncbi:hypothetical protein ACB098_02G142600 [Castanea mollissima]